MNGTNTDLVPPGDKVEHSAEVQRYLGKQAKRAAYPHPDEAGERANDA
jgi:hypothetical protein